VKKDGNKVCRCLSMAKGKNYCRLLRADLIAEVCILLLADRPAILGLGIRRGVRTKRTRSVRAHDKRHWQRYNGELPTDLWKFEYSGYVNGQYICRTNGTLSSKDRETYRYNKDMHVYRIQHAGSFEKTFPALATNEARGAPSLFCLSTRRR
jgi:hypothetical protein